MRRFAAVLSLLALFAVLAVPAFADQPAALETPSADVVAQPADEAPAAPTGEVTEQDTQEFLRSLEATAGADEKYACPGYLECTLNRDCTIFWELNCPGGTTAICDNPSGYACGGTCICC